MAYTKKGVGDIHYIVDTKDDLNAIENPNMGSTAWVVHEAAEYMADSKGEWVSQNVAANGGEAPSTPDINLDDYATIDQVNAGFSDMALGVNAAIAQLYDMVKRTTKPVKYEVKNVPAGTSVDYRDKEIRIFCPKDVVFTKQNVGPTGNENMYYMSFYAYAPEGAVSFKEGDRGTIVDTMFDFSDSAAGTDTYGRNYSVCWLALASYNPAYDTWTYYGNNSKADDMIGWDYVVEWYGEDGKMISTDKVRINLSNADCHFSYEPCYK